MKIRELLEASSPTSLPKDGRGNFIVWDPQRRLEVLVPEKDAAKLIARKQLVGGALNTASPSKYPEAPSQHNYNSSRPTDLDTTDDTSRGTIGHFVQGFKKGFTRANQFTKDFEYTPVGKAISGAKRIANKFQSRP